jgi:hypothetical protein
VEAATSGRNQPQLRHMQVRQLGLLTLNELLMPDSQMCSFSNSCSGQRQHRVDDRPLATHIHAAKCQLRHRRSLQPAADSGVE